LCNDSWPSLPLRRVGGHLSSYLLLTYGADMKDNETKARFYGGGCYRQRPALNRICAIALLEDDM